MVIKKQLNFDWYIECFSGVYKKIKEIHIKQQPYYIVLSTDSNLSLILDADAMVLTKINNNLLFKKTSLLTNNDFIFSKSVTGQLHSHKINDILIIPKYRLLYSFSPEPIILANRFIVKGFAANPVKILYRDIFIKLTNEDIEKLLNNGFV